jgi:hypothetical protein
MQTVKATVTCPWYLSLGRRWDFSRMVFIIFL